MMWSLLFVLGSLVSGNPAWAQSHVLSLEGALREAQTRSPRIEQAQAMSEEAKWRSIEAWGSFLPQLSLSANHFFDKKYQVVDVSLGTGSFTMPFIFPTSAVTLDARLNLFDGFQSYNRVRAAGLSEDAVNLEQDWTQFQVQLDVLLKFYQALAAQKLVLVADQNLRTLEDHLQKIKLKRSGGVATQFDVLRVEVQMDEARSEKLSSEDNLFMSRQRLTEALGLAEDPRLLKGDLPNPSPSRIQNLKKSERVERKDLTALQLRAEVAGKKQSEAQGFWIPKISVGYQYVYYNNVDDRLDTPFRDAYSLGVFLNWNLFDGAVSYARQREAAEQFRMAEVTRHMAQLKYNTDFEFWKRRYLYSSALYQAKTADVAKAQESVRLATEGMRAGARTNSEVLDAELDLFRARAGAVRAQLDAAEAMINLEMALGREI